MGRTRADLEALESRRMLSGDGMCGPVDPQSLQYSHAQLSAEVMAGLMPVLSGQVAQSRHDVTPAVGPCVHEQVVQPTGTTPQPTGSLTANPPPIDVITITWPVVGPIGLPIGFPIDPWRSISVPPSPIFPVIDPVSVAPGAGATFADDVNAFGADLYAKLRANDPTANVSFSPYSIEMALAMVYAGANGKTRDEMAAVLHLPSNEQAMLSQVAADQSLAGGGNAGVVAELANKLWIDQQQFALDPNYAESVQSNFGAGIENASFAGFDASEAVRAEINQWVSDKTHGKIPTLFDAPFDPFTEMAIVNALYFKGDWAAPFDANRTSEGMFHLDDGSSATASLMHQTAYFKYYANSDLQLLDMPYQGGQYSMDIVLPKDGLPSIDSTLNGANLSAWLGAASRQDVLVTLPKFSIDTHYDLPITLSAMGMPKAFTDEADFLGMGHMKTTPGMVSLFSPSLKIDKVIHKASVTVDEKGTEAAAATGISMVTDLAMWADPPIPIPFTADHPFYYAIRNNQTGAIIFSGAMVTSQS